MKIDMEIMYVPQANIYQLRDMMDDWRNTSNKISITAYVCALLNFFVSLILSVSKDPYYAVNMGCSAVFLVCGFASKRWYYVGYLSSFVGFLMCAARLSCFPIKSYMMSGALIIVCAVPMVFAYKCIYNYKTVFCELKKRKGFPNFIANTADLYADKMYFRTEKEKGKQTKEELYKENTEASYNPFSSEEEQENEKFRRQQYASVKTTGEVKVVNFEATQDEKKQINLTEAKKQAKESQKYKYGKSVFGREIIFYHNDIHISSIDDKRTLMWKWKNNIEWTMKDFGIFAVVMAMSLMSTSLAYSLIGRLLHYFAIIFLMVGTSYMRQSKWYGALITGLTVLYTIFTTNHILGLGFVIAAYIINPGIIFGTIRFALNYKTYKQLSKEEGFPSFIRTTADLYGDRLYIVEKQEPIVKKDPSQRRVKVMDIGFDEKPKKKDEGAWNAFNYMDEEKKGDNNES